jgi:hypothetical protein
VSRIVSWCLVVVVVIAATAALAPSPSTAAQEAGTLTLHLGTRRVIGTASSTNVKPERPAECSSSWAGLAYSPVFPPAFLLDGRTPDGGDGVSILTWAHLDAGAHSITIPSSFPNYAFTSQPGDHLSFWGVLYDASIPDLTATSGASAAAGTGVATMPETATIARELPVTGAGPDRVQLGGLLGVLATVFLLAGGIVRGRIPTPGNGDDHRDGRVV